MSPGFARKVMRLFGWHVEGDVPLHIRKFVVIAAPHTSWWDFPLGLFARAAIGRKIHFIGKADLFKPPLGWIMRWLGGHPVDRSKRSNFVDQVVSLFNEKEEFAISLAPEGTRKKVHSFKTGFYYIARGAGIPVICAQFDYRNRVVIFSKPFYTTEDAEADLRALWNHFAGVQGKRPNLGID